MLACRLLDRDGSMTRFISTLAVGACLFAGCTTTRTIRRPATAEELQSLVWKKRDHITLLNGDPGGSTSPVPPSLAPAAPPPEGDADVPMVDPSNLRGYEVKRRGVGALEGLALGTALGFLAGAVVGSAMGTDRSCQNVDEGCVELSSSNMALIVGLLGAVVGHAIGPLIGAAVGHTDRYIFSNESARP